MDLVNWGPDDPAGYFSPKNLFCLSFCVNAAMHPVQWVRLDPGFEWLCGVRMVQSERTLENQLNDSKDVVAQLEAVQVIPCLGGAVW